MKQSPLFLLCLFVGCINLFAQRNCSTMEMLERNIAKYPNVPAQMEAVEEHTRKYLATKNTYKANEVITIPVVFHIVYNDIIENISEEQVLSQLDVLNQDFRRTNSDADSTWSQAADTQIEFCLASFDPDGNPTNGITRTSTSVNAFQVDDLMKFDATGGKDAWSANDYLNIWICRLDDTDEITLGFAQPPNSGSLDTDGVVLDYRVLGTMGTAIAPFNLGRTGTHEVGHWLNLYHIWGDGGCPFDDFADDTPLSDAENYGCDIGHVSCGTVDMVQNYMDYSDDACMNLFTQDQKDRMRATFEPGGARASLLFSTACGAGLAATCEDGVQNQGETEIDCGGPCIACNSGCIDGIGNEITISLTFDDYPNETSWQITDSTETVVLFGGLYGAQDPGSTKDNIKCLPNGCYNFTIFDSYGDGLCCIEGAGSYSVTSDGIVFASGSTFTTSETTNFCLDGAAATPTCSDGILNQGETDVDCGGPCRECATCEDGILNQGETDVDCGGPCEECATCEDGILNQGETDVDCGGPCEECATCEDGILNQGETDVDCGGPCEECATCEDGILNQGETDVDCGGPCQECATCEDGILNQGETDVDCGGPCEECATCEDGILNQGETDVDCGGPCEECATCEDGILNQGETDIDCGGPCEECATCEDGILNQGETDIDCGGPCEECVSEEETALSLKVLLQGPAENVDGLWKMKDDLRIQNFIPSIEPYTALEGFNHIGGGGETVDSMVLSIAGDDAIIDWVFIELRESIDYNVIATKSALLKRNGDIVSEDGASLPTFLIEDGFYYVSVRHRNHLGVMTKDSIGFSKGNVTEFDFTSSSEQVYGTNAMVDLDGSMAMWAGNAYGGNSVIFQGASNDTNAIFFEVVTTPENSSYSTNFIYENYNMSDVDLNGSSVYQGDGSDTNIIFFNVLNHPENISSSPSYIIEEQLP